MTVFSEFEFRSLLIKVKDLRENFNKAHGAKKNISYQTEIEAKNAKLKQELLTLYPIILNDQIVLPISKKILSRLNLRLSWFTNDIIYSIYHIDAEERTAKSYVEIINANKVPKSIFARPWASENYYFTCRLYLQKCNDNEAKEKVLNVLQEYMIEQGLQQQTITAQNAIANSATNINMAKQAQQQWQNIVNRWQTSQSFI